LSSVVRHGSSDADWNAMPVILSGFVTGCPSMTTAPRDGSFRPVASFMKVDLPQPEGPTIATNSPRSAVSEMSSTAKLPAASSSSS
jgi:hypothetical protein